MTAVDRYAVERASAPRLPSPSYVAAFIRPVFFVRWNAPKIADVARVAAEFFKAHERFVQPIVYMAIVSEDCEPPNDAVRMAMTRGRDEVLPFCRSMHLVMEGHGFRCAILRNALATMQFFGRGREQVHIHRTVDEAMVKIVRGCPAESKLDPRIVLAKARAMGILSTPVDRKG